MALDATKFVTLHAGAQQLHKYNTTDAIATVIASGYFNSITNRLKQWDVVLVTGATGGTPTVDVVTITSATGAATVTSTATEGVTAT